jgi:hypothetical protein
MSKPKENPGLNPEAKVDNIQGYLNGIGHHFATYSVALALAGTMRQCTRHQYYGAIMAHICCDPAGLIRPYRKGVDRKLQDPGGLSFWLLYGCISNRTQQWQ